MWGKQSIRPTAIHSITFYQYELCPMVNIKPTSVGLDRLVLNYTKKAMNYQ
jgi:hypothetical protein